MWAVVVVVVVVVVYCLYVRVGQARSIFAQHKSRNLIDGMAFTAPHSVTAIRTRHGD